MPSRTGREMVTLTVKQSDSSESKVKRTKALAMLSGGLDSMLAIRMILRRGIDVEAVNFVTPFCLCNRCYLSEFIKELSVKLHRINLGQEFLDLVVNPPHGYGSQMNPCIDCRILMFRKAKEVAKRIGAEYIVTGEVLNERPFSQGREALLMIEKEAGLEGKILRPLSAKLLPQSEPEKEGSVDRNSLLAIRGRRRLPQIELARKMGVKDYPCPAGGCLLTDPSFARRLGEHLSHEGRLRPEDVTLLRVGRHFRLETVKIVVGRDEDENKRLSLIAQKQSFPTLEVIGYPGPVSLYVGEERPDLMERAAAITARYSDAPKETIVKVACKGLKEQIIETKAIKDEELGKLRV